MDAIWTQHHYGTLAPLGIVLRPEGLYDELPTPMKDNAENLIKSWALLKGIVSETYRVIQGKHDYQNNTDESQETLSEQIDVKTEAIIQKQLQIWRKEYQNKFSKIPKLQEIKIGRD